MSRRSRAKNTAPGRARRRTGADREQGCPTAGARSGKKRQRPRRWLFLFALFLILVLGPRLFLLRPAAGGPAPGKGGPALSAGPGQRLEKADRLRPAPTIKAEIGAGCACLWNADTGRFLYGKDPEKQAAPASTTKLLTALVVLDYCAPEEIVRVGREIQRIGPSSSTIWLQIGDRLSVEHLLDGLVLSSGNDAAYALAVYTGRIIAGDDLLTIDEALALFIEKMNEKARELGAVSSRFTTPDGFDADGYSTAADLARIGLAFFEHDLLREIAGTRRLEVEWACGKTASHRSFVEMLYPDSEYYFPQLIGGKTGFTKRAGNCAVTAAELDGQLYVCVVLNGETRQSRWQDSLTLYQAAAAL